MEITPNQTFSAPNESGSTHNCTGILLTVGFAVVGSIILFSVIERYQKVKYLDSLREE